MKKFLWKCSEWFQNKGKGDSAFAHFLQFAYRLLANSYVQVIVATIGTTVISIMTGMALYNTLSFWVLVITYIMLTLLMAWANQHIRRKNIHTKTFQLALYGLGTILRTLSIEWQKCAKKLSRQCTPGQAKQIVQDSNIDFQTAAFAVCEKLRDTLSKTVEKDDIYVTVFQKERKRGKNICKMIAHSAKHEVTSYEKQYLIPPKDSEETQFGKIEYHTYVFAKGIKEVTTFHNQKLVEEAFCVHEGCEDRERTIQQYVCIPISPAGLGVTFLLQVDTNVADMFGPNKTAVDDFAKNTIYPYAQILHMIYDQLRTVQQLTKQIKTK